MTTIPNQNGLPKAPAKNTAPALNVSAMSAAIVKEITGSLQATLSYQADEMDQLIGSMNALVNTLTREKEELTQRISVLESRTATYQATIAKNEAILAENEKKAREANKALDLMRLASELEQQEMLEKMELERRGKELQDMRKELTSDETAVGYKYDLKRQALEAGRGQYFSELSQELERLVEEAKKGEEPQVKAPDMESRRPTPAEKVSENGKG